MSTSENYIGQNALIYYLSNKNRTTKSYWRFLKKHRDTIIASIDITFTSTFLDNWKNLDNLWAVRFMDEGKDFSNLKNKFLGSEIIKEYKENLISTEEYNEKENVMPANSSDNDHFISIKNQSISNSSHLRKNIEIPIKNHSISTENNSKNFQLINFCYNILQELDIKSNIHPFYEISNENIKNSMDLFTIISKLENNQYA
ncbi:3959_t:CDS:2, partial [Rhizophagus irregularis]